MFSKITPRIPPDWTQAVFRRIKGNFNVFYTELQKGSCVYVQGKEEVGYTQIAEW